GLYQLRFLSRIPPSAAVDESVELVHAAKLRSAGSFVNAVLRRAAREPNFDPSATVIDPIEKLAIQTSHPAWLIGRWVDAIGFEEAGAFAHANNQAAPVAFRLTAKALKEPDAESSVIAVIESSNSNLLPSTMAPGAWRVTCGNKVLRELSLDGLIYFQDEASQLVAHLVDARGENRVLDVCAAPGSKATHIAALAQNAMIVAADLHEH